METKWKVLAITRVLSDGYVINIVSECRKTTSLGYGKKLVNTNLEIKESGPDYIAFEDLTEDVVLDWVKEELGEEGISKVEQQANESYEKATATPTTESGLPWG